MLFKCTSDSSARLWLAMVDKRLKRLAFTISFVLSNMEKKRGNGGKLGVLTSSK